MVPRAADRIARRAGWHPLLIHVVIHVPLMPAGDATLMSPDERVPSGELVDVELHGLRNARILHPEVDVVGEVVKRGNQSVVVIGQALRREGSDEVVVKQDVSPLHSAAAVVAVGRQSVEGWRTDVLGPRPRQLRARRGAGGTDTPTRRQ